MSMVKFLHTADWQLGMARHYLGHDAQARFSAARLDVIEQMARLATNEQCEFVVACGDVFESNQVQRQVLAKAFEKMAAFPQLTFFLLPGNHDPLRCVVHLSTPPTFTDRQPDNVKVLKGVDPVHVAPGVELIPASWPNKHPTTDLVDAACKGLEPSDAVRIVVGHGAIDSMSPDPSDPKAIALERLEERISAGLIHYVALGDRHSTTNVGTTGRVYYAGAPEPTDYDEIDPGNALIVDLNRRSRECRCQASKYVAIPAQRLADEFRQGHRGARGVAVGPGRQGSHHRQSVDSRPSLRGSESPPRRVAGTSRRPSRSPGDMGEAERSRGDSRCRRPRPLWAFRICERRPDRGARYGRAGRSGPRRP